MESVDTRVDDILASPELFTGKRIAVFGRLFGSPDGDRVLLAGLDESIEVGLMNSAPHAIIVDVPGLATLLHSNDYYRYCHLVPCSKKWPIFGRARVSGTLYREKTDCSVKYLLRQLDRLVLVARMSSPFDVPVDLKKLGHCSPSGQNHTGQATST